MRWIALVIATALAGQAAAAPPPDPCTGKLIDVEAVKGLCRAKPGVQTESTAKLVVTLEAPPSVVSGQAFGLELRLENRGKKPLSLLLVGDDHQVEISRDGKTLPINGTPPRRPRHCDNVDIYVPYWRIVLPPGGKAFHKLHWRADAPREPSAAGCDGGLPEPDDLAPLPAGSYLVAAGLPLAGRGIAASTTLVVTARPAPGAPGDPCAAKEFDLEQAELPECRTAPGSKPPAAGLTLKLVPSSTTVARGGKVELVLQITNTGAAPASILVHGGTLTVTAKDAKGRALTVAGKPVPPAPSCFEDLPASGAMPLYRQTLLPGGVAHGERSWLASTLSYGKTPRGCNPSEPEAGAPLPAGRYVVSAQLDGLGSAETTLTVTP